jgi:hypothetical protein
VDQHLASLHGTFDDCHDPQPRDGLRAPYFGSKGVRYDAFQGGFPIMATTSIKGINGVEYEKKREIKIDTVTYHGDLVYSTGHPESQRCVPYYPDPAAEFYAIGVRYAGTDRYLGGDPVLIPVYKACRYPDARPLAITIIRSSVKRSAFPTLQDVVLDRGGAPSGIPGSVKVTVSLARGDDFEVDVWCIPSVCQLAKNFALVEAIGTMALARAANGDAKDCLTKLRDMLPEPTCKRVHECLSTDGFRSDDWNAGYSGIGGLPTPGPKVLKAIAQALYETLVSRPIDEFAAVRTLRATHAVAHATVDPTFIPPKPAHPHSKGEPPRPELRLDRVPATDRETARSDYFLKGSLFAHLQSTSSLEIHGFLASPHSENLDDPKRGRGIRNIREGTWPTAPETFPPSRLSKQPLACREVFGFDITETGEVSFPKVQVVVQRVDNIPMPQQQQDNCRPDLEGQFQLSFEIAFKPTGDKASLPRVSQPFQFAGKIARRLDLRAVAYPRHAELMRTADGCGTNGKWLRNGKPLDEKLSGAWSECVTDVWLESAIRPAIPQAKSPIPAFVWLNLPGAGNSKTRTMGAVITRKSRVAVIRIPLARPWFSSGEGEKLGIVIWPPTLFKQESVDFAQDRVRMSGSPNRPLDMDGRVMTLDDFVDEDLGLGGKFITRWGGDPIREEPEDCEANGAPDIRSGHTFVPASAFLDLSEDTRLGFMAECAEGVLMPVKSEGGTKPNASGELQEHVDSPNLRVSLVTYAPRFDVENEEWYVDVTLEHPFEAEPFLRLGLVRYQEHAATELQVSYPTTQWIQLLPRRDVEVKSAKSRNKLHLDVCLEGLSPFLPSRVCDTPNAAGSQFADTFPPPNDSDDLAAEQKMTARVVREYHAENEALCRSVMDEQRVAATPRTAVTPGGSLYGSQRALWQWQFELEIDEHDDVSSKASYNVFIEEREARLPATFPNEPVSALRASGRAMGSKALMDSGPRFMVRVPV